jgi:hypothetical protein
MKKQEYINGINFWYDLGKRAALAVAEGENAFYDVVESYFEPKCDDKHGMALWSDKMECYVSLPLAWWRHALGMDDEKKFSDADVIAESRSRFMSEPARFSSTILWILHADIVESFFVCAELLMDNFEET